MQPNGIGIALDEFVDVYAIYCFGAPNSHLFPVDEYKHELLSSFLLRGLLGRGEPFLLFRHVMILVGKCHIKSRRSVEIRRVAFVDECTIPNSEVANVRSGENSEQILDVRS